MAVLGYSASGTPVSFAEIFLPPYEFTASSGFFLFAFAGFFAASWFHKIRGSLRLTLGDCFVRAIVAGFCIGRLGCAIIFDHVGTQTDFFLGQPYPRLWGPPEIRHNLGLYEFLLLSFVLLPLNIALSKRKAAPGVLSGVAILIYCTGRFFLDFLRELDARHYGLTPAQWLCIAGAFFSLGLLLKVRAKRSRA